MAGDQSAVAAGAEWLLCRSTMHTAYVGGTCTGGILCAVARVQRLSESGCQDDALFQSSAILPLLSSSRPASHCSFSTPHARPAGQSGKSEGDEGDSDNAGLPQARVLDL